MSNTIDNVTISNLVLNIDEITILNNIIYNEFYDETKFYNQVLNSIKNLSNCNISISSYSYIDFSNATIKTNSKYNKKTYNLTNAILDSPKILNKSEIDCNINISIEYFDKLLNIKLNFVTLSLSDTVDKITNVTVSSINFQNNKISKLDYSSISGGLFTSDNINIIYTNNSLLQINYEIDKNFYKSWSHGYLFFNSSYDYDSKTIPYINIDNNKDTSYNIIAETLTDNSNVEFITFDSLNEITDSTSNIILSTSNNYIISKPKISYSSNFFDHIDFDKNMNILFFISTSNTNTYYQTDTSSNYGYKEFAICIKDINISISYNGATNEIKHAKKQKILNYLLNNYYGTITAINYTNNSTSSLPDDNFYAIFNLMNFFYNNNITKIYNCDFSGDTITIISNSINFNNNKDLSYIDIDKSSNIYNILSGILLMEYTELEIETKVEDFVNKSINALLSDIDTVELMKKLSNIEQNIEGLKKQIDNNTKKIKKNKDHIDFHHYWDCDI